MVVIFVFSMLLASFGEEDPEEIGVEETVESKESVVWEKAPEEELDWETSVAEEAVEIEDETVEEQELEEQEAEKQEKQQEVVEPQYTYTELNEIRYASSAVNVRSLPDKSGNRIGGLSQSQEVSVTGQCNETGWYRINYNGNDGFVSDTYLSVEKPVIQTPAPEPSETSGAKSGGSGSGGNSSSGGGASVTVPSHSETGGNLVWVPVNGGTKYHCKSSCSKMENPIQVSVETATANGYTACKRCY